MALTDENGSNGLVMPVQPMGYYGGGYGNGFGNGFFGGDGAWLILFLFAMMGGWGGGFGGGFGGGAGGIWPWLMTGQAGINSNTNAGFDNAAINGQLNGIQGAITSGFANSELGAANRAIDALQTSYQGQIDALNRSFAAQTAVDSRLDGLDMNLQKCCCDNQLATESLRYTVATENAADRAALSDGIRDVVAAQTAGTQRILDKLCDQELQAERRQNDQLRTQLNMANLAASQAAQTASLIADNTQQTQYIVNRVAPYPIPAFPVGSPYGWNGYGYGNSFNNFGGGYNPFGNVGFGNGSF